MITVMILVVAVVLGIHYFQTRNAAPVSTSTQTPGAAPQTPYAPAPSAPLTPQATAQSSVPTVQAAAEQITVVENDLYRITFSNRGAQATSWVLKKFKSLDGKPLDLIHQQAATQYGYPLSLYTADPSIASSLNQAMFVPSATGPLAAPAKLSFTYSTGDVVATKTFTFDATTYLLHAEVSVTRGGVAVPALVSWPGGFSDQNETPNQTAYTNSQFDSNRSGIFNNVDAKKVTNGDTQSGPFDFAGVADPFFAAIFLPDTPATATVASLHHDIDVAKTIKRVGYGADQPATKPIILPVVGAALGNTGGPTETRIFVGPKSISTLKSVHAADPKITLEPVLEFGFWGVFGKYLFLSLQAIHTHITANWSGSWGWAIVILTVLINILMLPFKIKTMHSALQMQRIQPQTDAIKEKYKKYKVTDPKRGEMNAEIMALQKEHGVNMFGGCIPSLITFPLLIAFFTMIPRVIDLRQAHWLWLPDLQAPDPYHILPILMFVSMFVVQYYTPSPGIDPAQQKMMMFMMPAISLYWTWTYSSALALYWSVGNLIGILQQMVMNRTSLGREMRQIAAKRARRKAPTLQGRR